MESFAKHVRTALVLVVHDDTATGRRNRQIVADTQRTEKCAVGALAAETGLHCGHQGSIAVDGAIVMTAD